MNKIEQALREALPIMMENSEYELDFFADMKPAPTWEEFRTLLICAEQECDS